MIKLLKASEVAKILDVNPRKVYNLIKNKRINFIKVDKRSYRFTYEDVMKFIEDNKTEKNLPSISYSSCEYKNGGGAQ